MVKKLYICVLSFACPPLFGAASQSTPSKQIGSVIGDPGFVHLVYDQAHPEISAAYVTGTSETDCFGSFDKQDTLIGFFVGHQSQSVRQKTLSFAVEQLRQHNDENLYRPVAVGDDGDVGLSTKIACVEKMRKFALSRLKIYELARRTSLYTAVLFIHCRRGKEFVDARLYQVSGDKPYMPHIWRISGCTDDPMLRLSDFYKDEYAQEILRRISAEKISKTILKSAFHEWAQAKNIVGVSIDCVGAKSYFESCAKARSEN